MPNIPRESDEAISQTLVAYQRVSDNLETDPRSAEYLLELINQIYTYFLPHLIDTSTLPSLAALMALSQDDLSEYLANPDIFSSPLASEAADVLSVLFDAYHAQVLIEYGIED